MTIYIPIEWLLNTEFWAMWLTWGSASMTLVYLTGVLYISKVNDSHVTRGRPHHHTPTSALISPTRTALLVLGGPLTAALVPFGLYGAFTAEQMYLKREAAREEMIDKLVSQTKKADK